jgi:methylglutaconyl-CoA hydratase
MDTSLLESEPLPGIVQLTLNRPAARNALSADLMAAIGEAIARHGARAATRVVVIRANGPAFCAGADLTAMAALGRGPREANLADAETLAAILLAVRRCPKPTVAAVQGPAFGGGVGLTAACDVAVGAEEALFRLPEVRLGIMPAIISPYVVEAIGPRQARRYFLSGETISAARARELGLLHEVVPGTMLGGEVLRIATELAAGGPLALASCKELLSDVVGRGPDEALGRTLAARLATLRSGDEAQDGLAAAQARRAPGWVP